MVQAANSINEQFREILAERKESALYRSLQVNEGLIDFCSNDYLGFARSKKISDDIGKHSDRFFLPNGATGSRSISGNSLMVEELEREIAAFHGAKAGLIFNSGYVANLGLFSTIAGKNDTIICDELIHASIIDGCRLGYATRFRFAHNNVEDLEKKLKNAKGNVFVAVESVYSMDGDMAPLRMISDICKRYGAGLIVDEAHATGLFGSQGRGLVHQYGLQNDVFACVYTFGKALGSHGAIVTGSETLREYLVNFARSFIFTTALPPHSLVTTRSAYARLQDKDFDNEPLHNLIALFRSQFKDRGDIYLINSGSAIQSVVIPGNERVRKASRQLQEKGFDVRAILYPSVAPGKERLRVSLHLHNSKSEVEQLLQHLSEIS